MTQGKDVPRILKDEKEWGDEDTLEYIAKTMGVRFCVHIESDYGDSVERFRVFGSNGRFYHLEFNVNHYNALLKPEDVIPSQDEPTVVLDAEGGSPLSVPSRILNTLSNPSHIRQVLYDIYKQPLSGSFIATIETRMTMLKALVCNPAALNAVASGLHYKYKEFVNERHLVQALARDKFSAKSGRALFEHTPVKLYGPTTPSNDIGGRFELLSGKKPLEGPEGYQRMSEAIYMYETRQIV